MVYQLVAGFLLSSFGNTAKGESNLIQRLVTLSLIVFCTLIIIMSVNLFCYFSSTCTNFWEVLIPDWLEVYLGDLFLDQELQQQRNTSIIGRLSLAGAFGLLPQALSRFSQSTRLLR